jgi:hypothetical protein
MMSSSGIRRVADHMVIAAAALKQIARAMEIAAPDREMEANSTTRC